MKFHLLSNDVITHREEKEIDGMIDEDQICKVFEILQDSLGNEQIAAVKFKGFLIAMEQSDDQLLRETAKKFSEYRAST